MKDKKINDSNNSNGLPFAVLKNQKINTNTANSITQISQNGETFHGISNLKGKKQFVMSSKDEEVLLSFKEDEPRFDIGNLSWEKFEKLSKIFTNFFPETKIFNRNLINIDDMCEMIERNIRDLLENQYLAKKEMDFKEEEILKLRNKVNSLEEYVTDKLDLLETKYSKARHKNIEDNISQSDKERKTKEKSRESNHQNRMKHNLTDILGYKNSLKKKSNKLANFEDALLICKGIKSRKERASDSSYTNIENKWNSSSFEKPIKTQEVNSKVLRETQKMKIQYAYHTTFDGIPTMNQRDLKLGEDRKLMNLRTKGRRPRVEQHQQRYSSNQDSSSLNTIEDLSKKEVG